MARYSRRNSALSFYVNGRRAQQLDGLADAAGKALSAFDVAVQRATVGLRRRTLPAVSRAVRGQYNIKAGALSGKFRVEDGLRGRRGDRDDFLSIWASTRKYSLLEFGGRWGGRRTPGATAAVARGQGKTYAGAFAAKVGWRGASGGSAKADTVRSGIYVRQFETSGRRAPRGPLQLLRGPSPFEMLSGTDHKPSRAAKDAVLSEMRVFYTSELRRQFRLNRS